MKRGRVVCLGLAAMLLSGCASYLYPEQIAEQRRARAERALARSEGRLIEVEVQRPPIQSRYYP